MPGKINGKIAIFISGPVRYVSLVSKRLDAVFNGYDYDCFYHLWKDDLGNKVRTGPTNDYKHLEQHPRTKLFILQEPYSEQDFADSIGTETGSNSSINATMGMFFSVNVLCHYLEQMPDFKDYKYILRMRTDSAIINDDFPELLDASPNTLTLAKSNFIPSHHICDHMCFGEVKTFFRLWRYNSMFDIYNAYTMGSRNPELTLRTRIERELADVKINAAPLRFRDYHIVYMPTRDCDPETINKAINEKGLAEFFNNADKYIDFQEIDLFNNKWEHHWIDNKNRDNHDTQQRSKDTKFSFVMIVLNGMPFIEYSLKSVYNFAHEIIIVEGAVDKCRFAADPDGSSTDGTVEFIKSFPDPENKITLIQGKWPEKCEMQNKALEYVTGDYVWLIDSDEVYKIEDLQKIRAIILENPSISQVNFIPDNFWKGLDYIFVSPKFKEDQYHYRRIFKFVPGAVFTTHRPPTMVWPGSTKTTEQINLLHGSATRQLGITFNHYSYVLESQVKQKIELYKRYGWEKNWGIDLVDWYKNCFLKWNPENRKEIEDKYPIWTGDKNSYTEKFTGTHPKIMTKFNMNVSQVDQRHLPVIGSIDIQKKVLDAWDKIQIDGPVISRKNAIERNIAQGKDFWNIHVALAYLAQRIQPQSYLEIGIRTGCSLVQVIHNSSVKNITALDRWTESYSELPNTIDFTISQFENYHEKTGRDFDIDFIHGDSHVKLKELLQKGKKYDLITVDGDHSKEGAWMDLTDVVKMLQPKGVIVFDDIIHPGYPGLMELVEKFKQTYPDFIAIINDKQDNGCALLVRGYSESEILTSNNQQHKKNSIGPRIAEEYVTSGMTIDRESSFGDQIKSIFATIRPRKIIETGTYLGTGTTTIISNALKDLGITDSVFCSIEVNPENHARALQYFQSNNMNVYALNGLSIPRSMLPDIEQIHKNTIDDIRNEDIYVDHKQINRAQFYHKETNFPDVDDNLLYKSLKVFDFRPDFVLLDSGGHIGNIEFEYLIEHLKGPCHIALDDIYHIKHFKSFETMKQDKRFEIIVHSKEKFGFCIARFDPEVVERQRQNDRVERDNGTVTVSSEYPSAKNASIDEDFKNILWVRTDSIGDNIISSSMLAHIHEKYPSAKINVVCQEHIAELYESCPYVDQIITVPRMLKWQDENQYLTFIDTIRNIQPDVMFNSVYSIHEISDIPGMNFIPKRFAFRNTPDVSYTDIIPANDGPVSELNRAGDFLRGLNIEKFDLNPIIWTEDKDRKFTEDIFKANNLIPERTIALLPSAQHRYRLYNSYHSVVSGFSDFDVVILGGDDSVELGETISQAISNKCINLTGKTTIRQTAEIIRRCRLFLGAESAGAHIACAVGTPNVVLLGGGHFGRFMPYSNLTSAVCLPLDCYLCDWRCEYKYAHCVKGIRPEVVNHAIKDTLDLNSKTTKPRIFIQPETLWKKRTGQPSWKSLESLCQTEDFDLITVDIRVNSKNSKLKSIQIHSQPKCDQNKYPRISIVTPCYNQANYIEECMCSILDQGYPNLEYIVMDGGSIDGSVEIIKKYEKHLAYWQSEPDGGQYNAINEGFKISTGQIMTWLNSDDKFHPNSFRTIAAILTSRPDIDWIMGKPNVLDKHGNLKWLLDYLPQWNRAKYLKKIYDDPYIQQEGTFWTRSLWQKAGSCLRTDLEYAGDLELWTRFFRHSQPHTINVFIAGFREHGDQKSKLFRNNYTSEAEMILNNEIEIFNSSREKRLPVPYEPINLEQIDRIGVQRMMDGDIEDALAIFERVLETNPNFGPTHKNMGKLFMERGDNILAMVHFFHALELMAFDKSVALDCSKLLAAQGMSEYAHKLSSLASEPNATNAKVVELITEMGLLDKLQQSSTRIDIQSKPENEHEYLVSTIVSTYNSEEFIRDCLQDLEDQTIADKVEIIVIDSNSQQNEEQIVRQFQQKYDNIVYVKTEQREGIYSAWNRAVRMARGQLITNANTDDRHRHDALEIMANALLDNPDIALVYADQIITETPNPTFEKHRRIELAQRPEFDYQRLLFGCCVGSQPMWRKSLHEEVGYFDESLTCAGDWDMWLRMARKYQFKHITETLGLYYQNNDGIEHGRKIHSLYERYIVGRRYGNPYISVIPVFKSKDNPLVSIIMPAYNAQQHIAEAIESVLIQNYMNFELIVVDDGSTDNTKNIVLGFDDERIRYLFQENKGPAAALNNAISNSKGSFVIKLDSDDMMTPDFVAQHLKKFQHNPEADLVYCDDFLMDTNCEPIRILERPEYTNRKHLIRDMFRAGFPVIPFRTCIRRNVFDKIGLHDETLAVSEDYEMMMRFVKHNLKPYHLAEPLYLRRMTEQSRSRSGSAEKARCLINMVNSFTEQFTYEELFPDINWQSIPVENRKLHARCLTAMTCLAIGQDYMQSQAVEYATTAFEQANTELKGCLEMDPENQQIKQLLSKCEQIQNEHKKTVR